MSDPLYHTHFWAEFTDVAHPDLARAGRLDLMQASVSAGMGGTQSVSLTLGGRAADGRPLRDLLTVGDLLRVGAHRHTPTGTVQVTLAEDAVLTDYQVSEQLSQGSYSLTCSVSAEGLEGVLQTDAVAWWMYYGTEVGALRARGQLLPDDTSGKLDKVLANYTSKVAFHHANWQRAGVGLGDRLGYHFVSLRPNVPILYNLSIAEGSHMSILEQHAETGLHELFVQRRAQNGDRPFKGGYVHHPTYRSKAVLSSEAPGDGDGARPYLILRPKPFPYADKSGKPVLSEWNALILHDLTDRRATTGQHGFGHSAAAVRNFFMVFPGYEFMNDRMSFTQSLAVVNRASIQRFAYRPVKVRTNLVLNDGAEADMLDLARELTWRMAAQMNRMQDYSQGSVQIPLAPEIQNGDRVRFRLVNTNDLPDGIYQGYVTNVGHQYVKGNGGTTHLSLERVLPEATYQTPAWFVDGLEAADVNWPTPEHSAS